MTDVGDADDKYDGGENGGKHYNPDGIHESSTAVGNTEKGHSDTASREGESVNFSSKKVCEVELIAHRPLVCF